MQASAQAGLKRLVLLLVKRALGKLVVADDLDIHSLTAGTLELRQLTLNTSELNAALGHDCPVLLLSGSVAKVTVTVPWLALRSSGVHVELCGVVVHCAPRPYTGTAQPQEPGADASQTAHTKGTASRSRSAASLGSLKSSASSAVSALLMERLGCTLRDLSVRVACNEDEHALAVILQADALNFQNGGNGTSFETSGGARKQRVSASGLQLHVVGQSNVYTTCVVGAQATREQGGTSLDATVALNFVTEGDAPSVADVDVTALLVHCTPRVVRDALDIAHAYTSGRAPRPGASQAAGGAASQSLLDPKQSASHDDEAADGDEEAIASEEFYECVLDATAVEPGSPGQFYTPRAQLLPTDEESSWSVDHWRELQSSAAALLEPPADDKPETSTSDAPTQRPWRVACKLQQLSIALVLDEPQRSHEACVLACDAVNCNALLSSGSVKQARLSAHAVHVLRRGCMARARDDRRGAVAALPPWAPSYCPSSDELSVVELSAPDCEGKHALVVELHDEAQPRVACALQPCAVWIDAPLLVLANQWLDECALPASISTRRPRGWTIDVMAPQVRLAMVRGVDTVVIDIHGPPAARSMQAPTFSLSRDADSGELAVAAYLSAADMHICVPCAAAGECTAHRAVRAANLSIRFAQPQLYVDADADGDCASSFNHLAARAWSVAAAAGDATDEGRSCFTPASGQAEAKLRVDMLACAAAYADIDIEVAELESSDAVPLARLFGPPSTQVSGQSCDTPLTFGVAFALSLRCARLSLKLEGGSRPDGEKSSAIRLRKLALTQASGLDGLPGTSFMSATCTSLSCLSSDGTTLLRCGSDATTSLTGDVSGAQPRVVCVMATRPHAAHCTGEMVVATALHDVRAPVDADDVYLYRVWDVIQQAGVQCSPPAPLGPDGTPLPAPLMDIHVCALNSALAHQPPASVSTCGTLIVDSLSLRIDAKATAVILRGAALYVAQSADAKKALALGGVPTKAVLESSGHAEVARDNRVALRFTSEEASGSVDAESRPASVMVVDNECLTLSTHADTYAELLALMSQLQGGGKAAQESSPPAESTLPQEVHIMHDGIGAAMRAAMPHSASADSGLSAVASVMPPSASPEIIEDFFQRADGGSGLAAGGLLSVEEVDGGWTTLDMQPLPSTAASQQPRHVSSIHRSFSAPPMQGPMVRGYSAGHPPEVIANYSAAKPQGGVETVQVPPPHYPRATWRMVLHPLNIVWTLHAGAGFQKIDGGVVDAAPAHISRKASTTTCPVRGIRVALRRLTVRRDVFVVTHAQEMSPPAAIVGRSVITCGSLVVEDITPGCKWQRVMCTDTAAPRQAEAPDVRLLAVGVVPSPGAAPETRLHLAAAPLRVQLDQNIVLFTTGFFTSAADAAAADAEEEEGPQLIGSALSDAGSAPPPPPPPPAPEVTFFQVVECAPMTVRVDYQPRRFDGNSLVHGNAAEALNLAPWGDVTLALPAVRLTGVSGSLTVTAALADAWASHVAATQAVRFAQGLRGVRPLLAVLAAPVEGYRAAVSRANASTSTKGRDAKVMVRGAVRGGMALAKTLAREAKTVTRTVVRRSKAALRVAAELAANSALEDVRHG